MAENVADSYQFFVPSIDDSPSVFRERAGKYLPFLGSDPLAISGSGMKSSATAVENCITYHYCYYNRAWRRKSRHSGRCFLEIETWFANFSSRPHRRRCRRFTPCSGSRFYWEAARRGGSSVTGNSTLR